MAKSAMVLEEYEQEALFGALAIELGREDREPWDDVNYSQVLWTAGRFVEDLAKGEELEDFFTYYRVNHNVTNLAEFKLYIRSKRSTEYKPGADILLEKCEENSRKRKREDELLSIVGELEVILQYVCYDTLFDEALWKYVGGESRMTWMEYVHAVGMALSNTDATNIIRLKKAVEYNCVHDRTMTVENELKTLEMEFGANFERGDFRSPIQKCMVADLKLVSKYCTFPTLTSTTMCKYLRGDKRLSPGKFFVGTNRMRYFQHFNVVLDEASDEELRRMGTQLGDNFNMHVAEKIEMLQVQAKFGQEFQRFRSNLHQTVIDPMRINHIRIFHAIRHAWHKSTYTKDKIVLQVIMGLWCKKLLSYDLKPKEWRESFLEAVFLEANDEDYFIGDQNMLMCIKSCFCSLI